MTHRLPVAVLVALLAAAPLAAAAGGPTASVGVAASTKSGLSLQVTPRSGPLPFHATFHLKAPNAVSWELDFGDGLAQSATGAPPATVTHVYVSKGDFVARLSAVYPTVTKRVTTPTVTKPSPTPPAPVVSGPFVTLAVIPITGAGPRTFAFALATLNAGQISTWQVLFGDGTSTGGKGKPRASVKHTYARPGTYRAYVVFTDQGTSTYIRYSVPAGGLPVVVK